MSKHRVILIGTWLFVWAAYWLMGGEFERGAGLGFAWVVSAVLPIVVWVAVVADD